MVKDCLTKQSYVMLKQFAESFAKLSMRKEVLSDDALAAIIISTPDPDNSPPNFGSFTFVGTVDEYCMQFKEWLNSYIYQYKT
ncbi:hypothetical protein FF38_02944 [Lucilia cuprina]|uniref:Uncharacterized protein n=1 Tax=Lucilia cuprina TaxID=7375 RepID=A0A0L0C9L4_LUCCU|nr:hypothetical protein FF38_02944 [Lucilia cuprina]